MKDRKGIENQVADHLSRLEELGEKAEIDYTFPNKHVLATSHKFIQWSPILKIIWILI